MNFQGKNFDDIFVILRAKIQMKIDVFLEINKNQIRITFYSDFITRFLTL